MAAVTPAKLIFPVRVVMAFTTASSSPIALVAGAAGTSPPMLIVPFGESTFAPTYTPRDPELVFALDAKPRMVISLAPTVETAAAIFTPWEAIALIDTVDAVIQILPPAANGIVIEKPWLPVPPMI